MVNSLARAICHKLALLYEIVEGLLLEPGREPG